MITVTLISTCAPDLDSLPAEELLAAWRDVAREQPVVAARREQLARREQQLARLRAALHRE